MKKVGILKENEVPKPTHFQSLVSKLFSIPDTSVAYETWKETRVPAEIFQEILTEIELLDADWEF